MTHTVQQIADAIGADVAGDASFVITKAAEPQSAGPTEIALAMDPAYADGLAQGQAQAAILWPDADWQALGLKAAIMPKRGRFAMVGLTQLLDPGQGYPAGVHPSAVIDPTAVIDESARIGPLSVVGADATIGAGAIIGPHVSIGQGTTIGDNTLLREHVSIGAGVCIGARVILNPGVRIGGDGFSYATKEFSQVEMVRKTLGDRGDVPAQTWHRVHSLGRVTIGNDVEIGANSTVDSGTIRDTRIGDNCKIDNLVQIGHNVILGANVLVCAQAGIAGSAQIGDNSVIAGQAGIGDNVVIGEEVIASAGTVIVTNVAAGRTMSGSPATAMTKQMELYKAIRRLPRLMREVADLRKAVFKSNQDS